MRNNERTWNCDHCDMGRLGSEILKATEREREQVKERDKQNRESEREEGVRERFWMQIQMESSRCKRKTNYP